MLVIDVTPGPGPALWAPGIPALAGMAVMGVAAAGALAGRTIFRHRRRLRSRP